MGLRLVEPKVELRFLQKVFVVFDAFANSLPNPKPGFQLYTYSATKTRCFFLDALKSAQLGL